MKTCSRYMKKTPEDRAEAGGGHVADAPLHERSPPLQLVQEGVVLVSHLRHRRAHRSHLVKAVRLAPVHLRHVLHRRQQYFERQSLLGEMVVHLREKNTKGRFLRETRVARVLG